ncbi:MAG: flagellar biosynthesis protein FlgB [Brevundimonas subvibrioides]|uniref:Flagellar basal body rod protein FlgB n=1 Tax=Brevundimonas subvibrioides TaxID=74313 RepID=A0A258HK56_9CAUL|nr:flagellar biosynthesis protein FlgB [Brevundimonas subvibrioides]OYX57286.1 MAG: flagellar biosynthesis protein FlgB [Brevundimonas subvibrioides]
MGVADIPLLSQIKGRMTWLDERQRLIAQNVANSDTPGYVGRDLRAPTDFAAAMRDGGGLRMVQTSAGHMPVGGPNGAPVARFTSEASPDSETTLDGNAVVVEEQMLKMAESRMAYDAAIGLYSKAMAMIGLAAKVPGR